MVMTDDSDQTKVKVENRIQTSDPSYATISLDLTVAAAGLDFVQEVVLKSRVN